jgi:hypothetical protein
MHARGATGAILAAVPVESGVIDHRLAGRPSRGARDSGTLTPRTTNP